MSTATARLALTKPVTGDTASGLRTAIAANADALDSAAIFGQGLLSARPASSVPSPGVQGRFYYATDTDELYYDKGNGWVNATDAVRETLIDAKGDLIAGTADNVAARVPIGANGAVLLGDSAQAAGVRWGQADTAGIADGAITSAKIGSGQITAAKLAQIGLLIASAYPSQNLTVRFGTGSGSANAGAFFSSNFSGMTAFATSCVWAGVMGWKAYGTGGRGSYEFQLGAQASGQYGQIIADNFSDVSGSNYVVTFSYNWLALGY